MFNARLVRSLWRVMNQGELLLRAERHRALAQRVMDEPTKRGLLDLAERIIRSTFAVGPRRVRLSPGTRSEHWRQRDATVLPLKSGKGSTNVASPVFDYIPLLQRSVVQLRAQAEQYRRMATTARTADTQNSLLRLALRFDALANQREAARADPTLGDAPIFRGITASGGDAQP